VLDLPASTYYRHQYNLKHICETTVIKPIAADTIKDMIYKQLSGSPASQTVSVQTFTDTVGSDEFGTADFCGPRYVSSLSVNDPTPRTWDAVTSSLVLVSGNDATLTWDATTSSLVLTGDGYADVNMSTTKNVGLPYHDGPITVTVGFKLENYPDVAEVTTTFTTRIDPCNPPSSFTGSRVPIILNTSNTEFTYVHKWDLTGTETVPLTSMGPYVLVGNTCEGGGSYSVTETDGSSAPAWINTATVNSNGEI